MNGIGIETTTTTITTFVLSALCMYMPSKAKSIFILALLRMSTSRQTQLLTDLFTAYFSARKHKRSKISQLQFEANYEANIIHLREDIINDRYTIWPSTCFLISDPVVREIFAADFRDRVVHHLLYNYLYPLYDKHFIYDSYSCRLGKWTHLGVQRVNHFIRSCSQNYSKDCHILKLDIQWFFMSIDKNILWKIIYTKRLSSQAKFPMSPRAKSRGIIVHLLHQIIFHNPTKNYHFVWSRKEYTDLPNDKSLFHSQHNTWLPIGNITSQLFANVYLDILDKYIKYELKCKHYGRYVDDFVIVHEDKDFLLSIIPQIRSFLQEKLKLTLHPKKIYLQHYSKWVQFLWAIIKPHRTYINKRTVGNRKKTIYKHKNKQISSEKPYNSTNSYLWLCKHHKSYRVSRKIWQTMDQWFREKCELVDYVCCVRK